jgi:hypothetical protein
MDKTIASWLKIAALAIATALLQVPAGAQTAPTPGAQRPAPRPAARPAARPAQTRPKAPRPAATRPATLPSYPDRPQAERPRPLPGRPSVDRPTTLPSYPDRPQAERPRPLPPRPLPTRPVFRPNWGYQYPTGGRYFAGTVRCESYGGRFRSCRVPTRGRVVLERRHNGRCRYGNGWGYDRTRIWVSNNCRATFAYGVGSYVPRYRSDNDAALIIGGVAVAAGLIAILSRDGNDNRARAPQTAKVEADLGQVETRARTGLRACLDRAAADVGTTGGTRVALNAVTIDAMGGTTYRYDADIRATYPDRRYSLSFSCTATGAQIDDFDFITE